MSGVYNLVWDSLFFGYSVGKIDLSVTDKNLLSRILNESKVGGYKLIYVFLPYSETLSDDFLREYNGLLADIKVIYQCRIKDVAESAVMLEEYDGSADGLYPLAYASGAYSRFLTDKNFSKEFFYRLYRKWIDNSLNKQLADKVFVYRDGGMIAGFVTLKFCENGGSIGLIAVDRAFRGMSIGSCLIDSCKKCVLNNDVKILSVATQLNNNIACSFYEKNGFVKSQIMNIYHFWL